MSGPSHPPKDRFIPQKRGKRREILRSDDSAQNDVFSFGLSKAQRLRFFASLRIQTAKLGQPHRRCADLQGKRI
jgi:hypothetical protein